MAEPVALTPRRHLNIGLAELTVRLIESRSVVTKQYSQAPLQLHRPLYLDQDPYPTVFLKSPSAGLLGGDRHQFSLKASKGSTAKILNQAATLVYPGSSEQTFGIDIEDGATVFFEPSLLILASGAALVQNVRIDMTESSRLLYIDEWSAGRIAMNEFLRFESFDNTIEIYMDGCLQYRERFVLEPLKHSPVQTVIAQNFTRFKSRYQFGAWGEDELLPDFPQSKNQTSVDSYAWRLRRPAGIIDRLLSMPFSA